MKLIVFSTLSLLASVASTFHVVSPGSITACDPLTVQYDTRTGQAPFSLSFHDDSGDGDVLAAFTDISGTSFTWNQVTIPAGTNVVIILSDSGGKGSYTPPITVNPGSSDVCLNNPTSIPTVPTYTTSYPATSTFSGLSPVPSSLSSSISSLPSGVSSSLSSLSSVISSANSAVSSLSGTTSTPQPSGTSGLGTGGGITNTASVFTVAFISAIVTAILA